MGQERGRRVRDSCGRRWPGTGPEPSILWMTPLPPWMRSVQRVRASMDGSGADESFDMIFTGLQWDNYGFAQTGVLLARRPGWPRSTVVIRNGKDGTPGMRLEGESEDRPVVNSSTCRCPVC